MHVGRPDRSQEEEEAGGEERINRQPERRKANRNAARWAGIQHKVLAHSTSGAYNTRVLYCACF